MAIYSHATKDLIEAELADGKFSDASIINSDMDSLCGDNADWIKADIKDTNCNDSVFNRSNFCDCEIDHSNFINSQFNKCNFNRTAFRCTSLIKLRLNGSRLRNHTVDSCTLQRSQLNDSIIKDSVLKDFEGVLAKISQTVFINCRFEISYGSGMNGFSSARFENCIFINCSFSGYPLRGAETKNCTFINCGGEITDSVAADNTFGLPGAGYTECTKISNRIQAERIIQEAKNV